MRSLLDFLLSWWSSVAVRLVNSKRFNVMFGGILIIPAIFAFLRSLGVSDEWAAGVALIVGLVIAVFLHSQGKADAGKEAEILRLAGDILGSMGAVTADKAGTELPKILGTIRLAMDAGKNAGLPTDVTSAKPAALPPGPPPGQPPRPGQPNR